MCGELGASLLVPKANLVEIGRIWFQIGRTPPKVAKAAGVFGRIWTELHRIQPVSAPFRPNSARIWPNVDDVDHIKLELGNTYIALRSKNLQCPRYGTQLGQCSVLRSCWGASPSLLSERRRNRQCGIASCDVGGTVEGPLWQIDLNFAEGCGIVAHHTFRKVTPGDSSELRSCQGVAEKLLNNCRKAAPGVEIRLTHVLLLFEIRPTIDQH